MLSVNLYFRIVFFDFIKKCLTWVSPFDKLFLLAFYRKETGKWHAFTFRSMLSEPLLAVVLARLVEVCLFPGRF